MVKESVERTNVIQIGITLSDEKGQMPPETCSWQFNLRYNLEYFSPFIVDRKECCSQSSIDLLLEAGINFEYHKKHGIPAQLFAEHLTTSGLICSEKLLWVCFHGIFDFAYLLKLFSGELLLPDNEYSFQETLKLYFPHSVDLKTLAEPWPQLQGSLAKLSQDLGVI